MKRAVALFLVILMGGILIVGCGDSGNQTSVGTASTDDTTDAVTENVTTGDVTTVTFWAGLTGDDQQVMATLVEKFNEEQDEIQVEFYSVTWSEIFTKFSAASNTSSGPDVMLMHPTDLSTYSDKEMISSLDNLIGDMGISASDYSTAIWEGNQVNGSQYGIPIDYHPMAMFINLDMFETAGLTAEDAKVSSVEEFNELCEALTSDGQYAIGLGSNYAHTYRYWYGFLHQAGGSFLTEDMSEAAFNTEEGVKALDFMASWVTNGYAPEAQADIDADWLGGNTAMVIEGPWFIPTAMNSGMNFATVEFPQVFERDAVWGSSHTITGPVYDDRDEEVVSATNTFIGWLVENSFEWSASSGQIPANITVQTSEEYKNLELYEYAAAFINVAEYVVYEPLCPGTSEFGADNELSPVANAVYSVISGESNTSDALDTAAQSVNLILE